MTFLPPFFVSAAVAALIGLVVVAPDRRAGLYALPALATTALICGVLGAVAGVVCGA